MIDMLEMIDKLFESVNKLRSTIDKRYEVSAARADAEYAYRSALGKAMAELKVEGMAVTAIYNYARSMEHIAKLRAERDLFIAQEDYLTELIFYYRQCIKVYENQANMERKGL